MEIYLLRHGIAANAAAGERDAERALTAEGKKRLRTVLGMVKRAGAKPDLILTSPYRRAVETAKIAASVLGVEQELVLSNALTPGGDPEAVWDEIRALNDYERVLLASHEPLMSGVAAYLVGGPWSMFEMKKGAIARIDVEGLGPRPRGMLRWLLTPALAGGC